VSFRPFAAALAATTVSESEDDVVSVLSFSIVERRVEVDLMLVLDTGGEVLKACVVEADRTTAAERMDAVNFILVFVDMRK